MYTAPSMLYKRLNAALRGLDRSEVMRLVHPVLIEKKIDRWMDGWIDR